MYEGTTGYQPVLALWAEMNVVVVADEFRDGNVRAHQQLLPITQRAFQGLPETVVERYFRGDSACHEQSLLEWLRDEERRHASGHIQRTRACTSSGIPRSAVICSCNGSGSTSKKNSPAGDFFAEPS